MFVSIPVPISVSLAGLLSQRLLPHLSEAFKVLFLHGFEAPLRPGQWGQNYLTLDFGSLNHDTLGNSVGLSKSNWTVYWMLLPQSIFRLLNAQWGLLW